MHKALEGPTQHSANKDEAQRQEQAAEGHYIDYIGGQAALCPNPGSFTRWTLSCITRSFFSSPSSLLAAHKNPSRGTARNQPGAETHGKLQ